MLIQKFVLTVALILSTTAFAKEGGNSGGGGGNYQLGPAKAHFGISLKETREAAYSIAVLVEEQIAELANRNSVEMGTVIREDLSANEIREAVKLSSKIFGSGRGIYAILDEVKVEWGDCKHNGLRTDGSYSEVGGEKLICVSYRGIQKLNNRTAEQQVVGIIAHEAAHALAATEAEAKLFQRFVILNTPQNGMGEIGVKLMRVMHSLSSLVWGITDLSKMTPRYEVDFCRKAAASEQKINTATQVLLTSDLTITRPNKADWQLLSSANDHFGLGCASETDVLKLVEGIPNAARTICEFVRAIEIPRSSFNFDSLSRARERCERHAF